MLTRGMTASVPALLPQFIEAWSLTNTQAGWLTGIVSAGYMLCTAHAARGCDDRHCLLLGTHPDPVTRHATTCDSLAVALRYLAVLSVFSGMPE
jgi:hypothetical protein